MEMVSLELEKEQVELTLFYNGSGRLQIQTENFGLRTPITNNWFIDFHGTYCGSTIPQKFIL